MLNEAVGHSRKNANSKLTRRVTNKTPLQNVQLGISSLLFETP
ncbi:hypothetical protein RBSWK_06033 [Rhodopirellula baltica SWK14]|uniref:Uncharacterized protein n=1 Tax=Rhodopirellula baltica SWK14 TaxID=993516 RepID=L7C815_RHOBT|nr:hypothetical protein RBSWK_06033 [Rhodopirellula baltica SWK14]